MRQLGQVVVANLRANQFELLQLGQVAYEYVTAGRYLPAAEDSWWCSERWCGYWNICPFGARGRSNRPRS